MLQLAVDYSKQRQQFGRPIGSFQAVKHAAAQMLVTVESSLSIVCYAAQSVEEGLTDRAIHAAVRQHSYPYDVYRLAHRRPLLSAQHSYCREIAQIALRSQNLSAIQVSQRSSENEREILGERKYAPT